jgi:hypothetical protein
LILKAPCRAPLRRPWLAWKIRPHRCPGSRALPTFSPMTENPELAAGAACPAKSRGPAAVAGRTFSLSGFP